MSKKVFLFLYLLLLLMLAIVVNGSLKTDIGMKEAQLIKTAVTEIDLSKDLDHHIDADFEERTAESNYLQEDEGISMLSVISILILTGITVAALLGALCIKRDFKDLEQ